MHTTKGRLSGCRVLLVEDEVLVALDTRDGLEEHDAVVVGPAFDLDTGMGLARTEQIDVAVLDVNLDGQLPDRLTELLRARSVPFLFATGYQSWIPDAQATTVTKPYTIEELVRAIVGELSA